MNGTEGRMDSRMGRFSEERAEPRPITRPYSPLALVRLVLWSILHFVFYFLQQVAELLAPLLLVVGLGWWALPHVVGTLTTSSAAGSDTQARDILNSIAGTIPSGLHLAGHWITPGGLIVDGLLLMAFAALGATLSAVAARGM